MGVTVREKEKGSGVYWVFINHNNKRRSKKVGAKTAAEKVRKDIERKIAQKELGLTVSSVQTLKTYGSNWLNTFIAARRSRGTYTRYKGLLEQKINKHIGNKRIDQISRGNIKAMNRRKDAAGTEVRNIICEYREFGASQLRLATKLMPFILHSFHIRANSYCCQKKNADQS